MIALLCAVLLGAATPGADGHLLAGARAFRAARYDEALVEFRVAGKLAHGGEASWYAAAALQKLGRSEEAVEAFAAAEKEAPAAADGLLRFYRALACYDAKLYGCADRLFAEVGDTAGPKLAEQARKTREWIAVFFRDAPPESTAKWYRDRAAETKAAGREALSRAYADEADALAARRAGR